MSNMGKYLNKIIEYENGNLTEEEGIELFQYLCDTGLVFNLQGHYHRTAQRLINQGLVRGPKC